jgi:hypothetical protein
MYFFQNGMLCIQCTSACTIHCNSAPPEAHYVTQKEPLIQLLRGLLYIEGKYV